MCRSRLELYSYLDYPNFGYPANSPPEAEHQCVSLNNFAFGGGCNVNGVCQGVTLLGVWTGPLYLARLHRCILPSF